ncbi:MAG: hypothetical protein WD059_05620 [Balneolaceae bacterium]
MEKISQKDIDWLLNLKSSSGINKSLTLSQKRKKIALRVVGSLCLFFTLTILPFYLLIRTSVYLYLSYGFNGWISLTIGIIATILLLVVYMLILLRKVENRRLLYRYCIAGITSLVLGFSLYGVFYISSVNAKSEEIRSVYRSLHPVLRVAVATTTLADGGLIITDIQRNPEDYETMGLPVNHASLHYTQENGYVHAIDLRTAERWAIRNFLLRTSLEIMGFNTLRHVGTADHLHVALPLRKQ